MGKLTDRQIRTASKAGYLQDGNGLQVKIRNATSKSFELRVQRFGKRYTFGLGSYPQTSLREARKKAEQYKEDLSSGKDPTLASDASNLSMTFKEASIAYIEKQRLGWKNPKHAAQWTATLQQYVWPHFGNKPVEQITTTHVLKALEPIWSRIPETASRVRQRIEAILNYYYALNGLDVANPARWKGKLDLLMPATSTIKPPTHFKDVPYNQLPSVFQDLSAKMGVGAIALRFLMLTAARSGEIYGMVWNEVDLEAGVWTIPARRMKAGKEHRVALSNEAKELLKTLLPYKQSDLVFLGNKQKSISDATMRKALRSATDPHERYQVHGLRGSFKTWASEKTYHSREVIEAALAHQLKDKAEAAYVRGDLFDKRKSLMADWGGFLTGKIYDRG